MVHFYRNVFSHVPAGKLREVALMLKAIHAQEDLAAAQRKAAEVVARLHSMRLGKAAELVETAVPETLASCDDAEHLDVIEYFHIVPDQHDVIDAEGALCDTFLETTGHTALSDDRGEEYDGTVLPAVCAPFSSYRRRRNVLKSRLRSALSPIVDLRRPLDRIRDRIEERIPPAS